MFLLKKTIGIRITADEENKGIDVSTFGVKAYNFDE